MSEPKEQLRQQGWHKVGRIADGRWAGQSEAEEPAYQLAVRFVEGRPVEAEIWHRVDERTTRPSGRLPVDAVPTPIQAAGLHETAWIARRKDSTWVDEGEA
jgi:hypothetical protein